MNDGVLDNARSNRYQDWGGEFGQSLLGDGASLEMIANQATGADLDPQAVSGRQELLENEVNRVLWSTT